MANKFWFFGLLLADFDQSITSIIVSALSFFAATFGVGMYSDIDMISSLCRLMARGAIISMFVVILLLPAVLRVFDPVIIRTSMGFKDVIRRDKKESTITQDRRLRFRPYI